MKALSKIFSVGIFAFFLSPLSFADDAQYRVDALVHAEEAVKHGNMGHTKELLDHAKESLALAKEASKAGGDTHMDKGIRHLEEAIKHAEMGHIDVATEHADKAIYDMRESGARAAH